MGAHDDVDGALGQSLEDLLGLRRSGETAQLRDARREVLHPVPEGLHVLLREQRRWDEDGDLFAGLDGFESGAHRDLRLAVAHITHDDAVHRHRLFHVGLNGLDGVELVLGLGEGESLLHLPLPRAIRGEGVARRGLALGVELHELPGDFPDGLAGLALGVLPIRTTHLGQGRLLPADVAGQQVELVHGDVELVARSSPLAGCVFEDEVFAAGCVRTLADGALGHLHKLADAVRIVDHQVAGFQGQGIDAVAALGWLALTGRRRLHAVAGDVRFGEEQQAGVLSPSHREDEALVGDRVVDADLLWRRLLVRGRLGCGLTADAALAT